MRGTSAGVARLARRDDGGASPRLPSCFPEKSPSSAPCGAPSPHFVGRREMGEEPPFCLIREEGGAARGRGSKRAAHSLNFPFSRPPLSLLPGLRRGEGAPQ